jgi:hypothetical protein
MATGSQLRCLLLSQALLRIRAPALDVPSKQKPV